MFCLWYSLSTCFLLVIYMQLVSLIIVVIPMKDAGTLCFWACFYMVWLLQAYDKWRRVLTWNFFYILRKISIWKGHRVAFTDFFCILRRVSFGWVIRLPLWICSSFCFSVCIINFSGHGLSGCFCGFVPAFIFTICIINFNKLLSGSWFVWISGGLYWLLLCRCFMVMYVHCKYILRVFRRLCYGCLTCIKVWCFNLQLILMKWMFLSPCVYSLFIGLIFLLKYLNDTLIFLGVLL